MESPAKIVVADAGPLIHLDELDCLDLVADFPQVLVTNVVRSEVRRHRPQALAVPGIPWRWVEQSEYQVDATLQAIAEAMELDLGETTALAVMQHEPAALFLTDDAAARLAAETLGYAVHGTIGILLRAIRRNQRSPAEILGVFRQLTERSSLHIAPRLLATVIDEVNRYIRSQST